MSSVVINGDTSGSVTLSAPAVAGTVTVTLPATSGTMLTTASSTGISGSAISSGTVPEAYGGTGTNTGYYGFKNRIINGAMVIDQRNAGAAQTITTGGGNQYTVDRWYAVPTGANVTGQQITSANISTYRFTGAASNTGIYFIQRIEAKNIADCANSTVTLSCNLANSLLTTVTWTAYYPTASDNYSGYTQIATGTFTVNSTLTNYSTQISLPSSASNGLMIQLNVGAQTSGTWTIGNVQLEKGSTATSFDYRDYGSELALCQRYFETLTTIYVPTLYKTGANGTVRTSVWFYKVTKRATPTVTTSNISYDNCSGLTIDRNSSDYYSTYATANGGTNFGYNYDFTSSAEL